MFLFPFPFPNLIPNGCVEKTFQVEQTIDQVQEAGSGILDIAKTVFEAVKPGLEAALPVLKQAGEVAFKVASPVVSEASKKAQEAIQSAGIDTDSVVSAAKVTSILNLIFSVIIIYALQFATI